MRWVRLILGFALQVVGCLIALIAIMGLAGDLGPLEFIVLAAVGTLVFLGGLKIRAAASSVSTLA